MSPDQTVPVPAGWYPDPYGLADMRWWNGQSWTDSVHPPVAPAPLASEPVAPEPVEPEPAASAPLATPVAKPTVTPVEAHAEGRVDAPAFDPITVHTEPELPPLVVPEFAPPRSSALLTGSEASTQSHDQPESPELAPSEPNGFVESLNSATRLPSRREMRLRKDLRPEAEPPNLVSAFSELGLAPGDSFGGEDEASEIANQPMGSALGPLGALSAPPAASLPSTFSAVPDSSTPTAFDWLSGPNTGELDSVPAAPVSTAAPTVAASPMVTAPTGAQPPSTAGTQQVSTSGFPPLGTPVGQALIEESSVGGFSDPPTGVTDAWTRETTIVGVQDDFSRPTATRKTTVSGWFIAAMPLITGVLSLAAVKGKENYPRYVPVELEWWMLVLSVIGVLYLVTLLLAVADSRKLDWAGYNQPARWTWALLGAPVYLLVRTVAVKRETGRVSILLWVWIALTIAVIGAWAAAGFLVPDLVANYPLPFA